MAGNTGGTPCLRRDRRPSTSDITIDLRLRALVVRHRCFASKIFRRTEQSGCPKRVVKLGSDARRDFKRRGIKLDVTGMGEIVEHARQQFVGPRYVAEA